MVLAEVPLWVIHSSSSGAGSGGGAAAVAAAGGSIKVTSTTTGVKTSSLCETDRAVEEGRELLGLLSNRPVPAASTSPVGGTAASATSGGGKSRCAIYSVDLQPTLLWPSSSSLLLESSSVRFATGGGDGMVRIWSVASLFDERRRRRPTTDNVPDSSAGDEKDNVSDSDGDRETKRRKTGHGRMGGYTEGGGYVSSEESTAGDTELAGSKAAEFAPQIERTVDNFEAKERLDSEQQIEGETTTKEQGGMLEETNTQEGPEDRGKEPLSEAEKSTSGKDDGGTKDMDVQASNEARDASVDPKAAVGSELPRGEVKPTTSGREEGKEDEQKASDTVLPAPVPIPRSTVGASSAKKRKRAALTTIPLLPVAPSAEEVGDSAGKHDVLGSSNGVLFDGARLLCSMASHSGSVLCVRWSSDGRYLASAGDDSNVVIYSRVSGGAAALYARNLEQPQDAAAVEHWQRIRICRGHDLDVVGLAWAPDDSHLVSCSWDSSNPIIVWKLNMDGADEKSGSNERRVGGKAQEMVMRPFKVLGQAEHTSTVKGVAFDPAGKYVISSGDDPALCVWRAFDDWGLEKRIGAEAGIFRTRRKAGEAGLTASADEDATELSNLSLFRRVSFAPDGTHVCGTNATLRGKNIAAMVSREGWTTSVTPGSTGASQPSGESSAAGSAPSGAANLVGHKQPVVSSRHCPYFFTARKARKGRMKGAVEGGKKDGDEGYVDEDEDEEDHPDVEPSYSTLVALGDKRGFVTIWSTRRTRPLFKLQCSESRCTVTDLSWGLAPPDPSAAEPSSGVGLVLVISLLDGFVVALRFDVPREVGAVLSDARRRRIFRLKYGIELESGASSLTGRRRLVDDKSGPKLIENALQYALEEGVNDEDDDDDDEVDVARFSGKQAILKTSGKISNTSNGTTAMDRLEQRMGRQDGNSVKSTSFDPETRLKPVRRKKQKASKGETVRHAIESAGRAAAAADAMNSRIGGRRDSRATPEQTKEHGASGSGGGAGEGVQNMATAGIGSPGTGSLHHHRNSTEFSTTPCSSVLSLTTSRVLSVELVGTTSTAEEGREGTEGVSVVADCANTTESHRPGVPGSVSVATLSISHAGRVTWRDQIRGTSCSAIAACKSILAIGTADGTLLLYGTSPSLGWESGVAFRSFPPFVFGGGVVRLHLRETETSSQIEILVLTTDATFAVYDLVPKPKLQFKGSVMAPWNQMRVSTIDSSGSSTAVPKVARLQITDSRHLLLILSLQPPGGRRGSAAAVSSPATSRGTRPSVTVVGGSLQGFIYNREMEVWMRISDSRFQLSDFFSSLPTAERLDRGRGILETIEDVIRSGGGVEQSQAEKKSSMTQQTSLSKSSSMYHTTDDGESAAAVNITRSHCEDRMACALALSSAFEFKYWFKLFARQLASDGNEALLRCVADMITGRVTEASMDSSIWWLSNAQVVGLDRKDLLRKILVPEMSRNRALQRLTNEVSLELDALEAK